MDTYLVGGAVRDALLGLPVKERDWVIVGSAPETLLAQGFSRVGKDFPVFLHPKTHEEYALARTERKNGHGYNGFVCYAEPSVTLEEDLARRDLTVNAIAQDERGNHVDPFNGIKDLRAGILRHVSPAFVEDPLRVLRVARFAAQFYHLGFTIAPETLALMRAIAHSGELGALTPERIFQECARALETQHPAIFFLVLRSCGALSVLFPTINALFGVPQSSEHHPEIDVGVHVMMVVNISAQLELPVAVRFAALMHDLGKGMTPTASYPSHPNHETAGVPLVEQMCARYRLPSAWRDLAILVTRHHGDAHDVFTCSDEALLALLLACDAIRRPERFEQFLLACQCDYQGRIGYMDTEYPQLHYLREVQAVIAAVKPNLVSKLDKEIKKILHDERLNALSQWRKKKPI